MLALSVKPKYADKILAGTKTREYRTWRPRKVPRLFVLHVSQRQELVALVEITGIEKLENGYAYRIHVVRKFRQPVKCRGRLGFWKLDEVTLSTLNETEVVSLDRNLAD